MFDPMYGGSTYACALGQLGLRPTTCESGLLHQRRQMASSRSCRRGCDHVLTAFHVSYLQDNAVNLADKKDETQCADEFSGFRCRLQLQSRAMNFREPLPPQCPPATASEIAGPRAVYRLVKSLPPGNGDFRSQRELAPNARFGVPECLARGLSVHSELQHSLKAAKLPRLRGYVPCLVKLDSGAGFIEQTSSWSHHTWWPYADFDILAHCEGVSS